MIKGKVFCLGLSRTGTTSLHLALIALGMTSIHYPAQSAIQWMHGNFNPGTTRGLQAFADIPVGVFFKELHRTHPDAVFIYTRRDPERWLDSAQRHFDDSASPSQFTILRDYIRLATYGTLNYNRRHFLNKFLEHDAIIREYFKKHPSRLLTIDLDKEGMSWEPLAAFLDVTPPDAPFPHARSPDLGKFNRVGGATIEQRQAELLERLRTGRPV